MSYVYQRIVWRRPFAYNPLVSPSLVYWAYLWAALVLCHSGRHHGLNIMTYYHPSHAAQTHLFTLRLHANHGAKITKNQTPPLVCFA